MEAAVDAIVHAATASDGTAPVDEATLIALADGVGDLRRDDGGFAHVHDGELALVVHPASRGQGVASRLLGGLDHAGPLLAWSHGNHPAAARLAARHGWERVRDLWVMRLPASPVTAPTVEGVTIRAFEPADAAEVVRVNAAAFANHPEQGEMDLANFSRRMAEPWFDPAGLLVADSGRGLLGFHWTKRHNSAQGEVYVLGVDPAAQGRGLGRALTLAGLAHLAGLGVSEVILYVEASNTAAIRLYEGLGFTHDDSDTHVQYRRG
jgi:mycothiol synthase